MNILNYVNYKKIYIRYFKLNNKNIIREFSIIFY